MYRSLSELRNSINQLIEQQGEDAPCAAFVFTKEDVFYCDEDYNEHYMNDADSNNVLSMVGSCGYIYERVGDIIEDEVLRVRNKVTT
jgi:hypothetical protein